MNWLKVAAVVIGALIAFLIVGEVVHVVLALLGYVVIAALIAGGGYVAYKVVTSSRRREVKERHRDRKLPDDDHRGRDHRQADYPQLPSPSRPNVDDELDRMRRDMGR
ncbi:MAG TPA: hypothetical protein VMG38_01955 [Trebonia sp.]|nr:hypothetical protein [Trebonia sp.]